MGGGKGRRRFLVSGLVNVETTLRIEAFPLEYVPERYPFFGAGTSVSGVGVNVSLALSALGDRVEFLSLAGRDGLGSLVISELAGRGLPTERILRRMAETAQSVILYDAKGRRQIHVDLKDIQERRYPAKDFDAAAARAGLAVLCNINFNRPFLKRAKARGLPVATDVHVLKDPLDAYNADFMGAADILFLSDERLWAPPEEAARELASRYGASIIVVGMGAKGSLLLQEGEGPVRVKARRTRPVVNTIGAGDALFSSFLHFYAAGRSARESLERASLFASWKIGEKGAAAGFLGERALLALERKEGGARTGKPVNAARGGA